MTWERKLFPGSCWTLESIEKKKKKWNWVRKLKIEGWCCGPRREGVNILEVELRTKLKTEGLCCGPRRGRSQHFRSGVEYEVEDWRLVLLSQEGFYTSFEGHQPVISLNPVVNLGTGDKREDKQTFQPLFTISPQMTILKTILKTLLYTITHYDTLWGLG